MAAALGASACVDRWGQRTNIAGSLGAEALVTKTLFSQPGFHALISG